MRPIRVSALHRSAKGKSVNPPRSATNLDRSALRVPLVGYDENWFSEINQFRCEGRILSFVSIS